MSPLHEKNSSMSPLHDDMRTQAVTVKDSDSKEIKMVSFKEAMDVVLIPSRNEYFKYSCDLWWKKKDYISFQQAAFSEIKLYALCESIEFKEARDKLYQPDLIHNEIPIEHINNIGGYSQNSENIWPVQSIPIDCKTEEEDIHCGTPPKSNTQEIKKKDKQIETLPRLSKEEEDDLTLMVKLSNQAFSFETDRYRHSKNITYPVPVRLALLTLTVPIVFSYLFIQKSWL